MSNTIVIYLMLGIISRVIFFIVQKRVYKKYNFEEAPQFGFIVELIAHALDVIGWPISTIASGYLIYDKVRKYKKGARIEILEDDE